MGIIAWISSLQLKIMIRKMSKRRGGASTACHRKTIVIFLLTIHENSPKALILQSTLMLLRGHLSRNTLLWEPPTWDHIS